QTPPEFKEEYAAVMKRYNAEIPEYYIQAVFDEKVNLSIKTPPLEDYSLISNYADSIHVFKLFDSYQNLQPIDLKAENLSGLESFIYNAYSVEIDNNCINLHDFEQIPIGNELAAVRKTYDFDGNGKRDFIAQEIEGEDRVLKIFEISGDELITKYTYSSSCWPHDIGDTNGDGMELLAVTTGNIAVFYETSGDVYPNHYMGFIEESYGGNFVDYDGDGIDDIILIEDTEIDHITYRVLALRKRLGDIFIDEDGEIFNETATSVNNAFVNKVAGGNLDGDAHQDILSADCDGDVMIFEKESSEFEMVWHCRLPVSDAYYLALADFTGDGSNEFCVGGYTYNPSNPAKSFSYFEFFKNTGENNEYGSLGYLSFSQIEIKNSIANADIDGDGDDELVLSVPPNTYIIDYVDNKFTPIWKGESTKTSLNVIAASPKTATEDAFIIVNIKDGDEIKSSLIRKTEDFTGPQTPNMFGVFPVDSTSVTMNWLADDADSYNIFRKQDENISMIASGVTDNFYTDSGLSPADTLFYQITAVDDSYTPDESLPTLWKIAVPFYMPQLQYIKMISSYEIKVKFDRKLNSDATNITFYSVNHNMGYPQSVNVIEQNSCLIMRFSNRFEKFDDYLLSINGLTGMTGVPVVLDPEDCVFQYEPDTTPPEISNVESEDLQTVNVYFSEAVKSEMAEDISNYILVLPALDKNNEIVSLEYNVDDYYVTIRMKKKLEYTNQPYFLKIDNLEDIAGNKISNNGNKCHFSLTGMLGLKNLKQLQVYPNPLDQRKSEFDVVNFINLPLETSGRIWIYDLNGDLVFEKDLGPYNDVKECFRWECKNKAGNKVSSGIYFYIIKMGTDSRKGKIIIIN
ncbi:MAG: T9SS type A sorting domain-containing protein, partial [Candidatus Cloacimonetes bacterium]|nr:T9SS type A sorting domain-containing protein [Candidatus Cloacimonadota bacterium]